jgi:hypothetical protein
MTCNRAHNDAAAHVGAPLLPAAAKLRLERWVAAYDMALVARDAVAFLALRSSNLSRSLDLDEHVPNHAFFSYVNAHQPWIDALEKHMGLSALWRPRRSVLAIGAAHAMIDGYLSAKHGHTVVALDLPWIYLRGDPRMAQKLRRIHCSEILSSPLAISMLAHARLAAQLPPATVGPYTHDAVSFGGSTTSVLQKAGRDAPSLLAQAARIARRWILIFQQPLVRADASPPSSGADGDCPPLDPLCRPGKRWPDGMRGWAASECNVVPNCRNESVWRAFFAAHAPAFALTRHGVFGEPRVLKARGGVQLTVGVARAPVGIAAHRGGSKFHTQAWFVLTRRTTVSARPAR